MEDSITLQTFDFAGQKDHNFVQAHDTWEWNRVFKSVFCLLGFHHSAGTTQLNPNLSPLVFTGSSQTWLFATFCSFAPFCVLLRPFAPFCALLRICVCTLLHSFALICVCVRPSLERPRLGTADFNGPLSSKTKFFRFAKFWEHVRRPSMGPFFVTD